jgi:hypothetical protein
VRELVIEGWVYPYTLTPAEGEHHLFRVLVDYATGGRQFYVEANSWGEVVGHLTFSRRDVLSELKRSRVRPKLRLIG